MRSGHVLLHYWGIDIHRVHELPGRIVLRCWSLYLFELRGRHVPNSFGVEHLLLMRSRHVRLHYWGIDIHRVHELPGRVVLGCWSLILQQLRGGHVPDKYRGGGL